MEGGAGRWPYRVRQSAMSEPTALASLALLATDDPAGSSFPLVQQAGATLAGWQQPDGSVGIAANQPTPAWPTAMAVLLWRVEGRRQDQLHKAVRWLTRRTGLPVPLEAVTGHDTTIPGWPWVEGTHGWIEPTAWAVLALHGAGGGEVRPRIEEGLRLIRDRATPLGGWNWGNSTMFNVPIRPQPDLTGLALLALSIDRKQDRKVEKGLRYLEARLPETSTPRSLCWGLLGLEAWGRRPAEADAWIERAVGRAPAGEYMHLAELLLAAGRTRSLALLGLEGAS
jgi:hypothetical protein